MPEARPECADAAVFGARIVDPARRESVVWPADNSAYSWSRLAVILGEQHGMKWRANNIAIDWRIVGRTESMWQQAERLARGPTAAG